MGLARDSMVLYLGRMITTVLAAATPLYLAFILSPDDFGYVTIVFVLAWGGAVVLDFGVTPAHTYLVAKDSRDRIAAFTFSIKYMISAMIFFYLLVVIKPIRYRIEGLLGDLPWPLFLYAMSAAPMLLLLQMYRGQILGMRKTWGYNNIDFMRWGSVLLFILLFQLVGRPTPDSVCKAWLIGLGLTTTLFTFYIMMQVNWSVTIRPNYFTDSMVYGLQAYVASVGFFVMRRVDYLFLMHYHDAPHLAVYNLATQFSEVLLLFPAAVGLALFPISASLEADEANDRAAVAARVTLVYALLGAPLLALGFYVVLYLLGIAGKPLYLDAMTPFLYLLPGCVVLSVDTILSQHFQGRKLQRYNSYVVVAMLLANLVLNFLLIPTWGMTGAAIATTLSYIAGGAWTMLLFLHFSDKSLSELLLPRFRDLAVWWDH